MGRDSTSEAPKLTGAALTMTSWTKVIDSYAAVPEIYQDALRALLGERQPFPRVVYAPVLPGVQHKTTEKLVFEADETLHILKRIDGQVKMYAYPFDAICDIEVGNILLYSWITIRGVTREGATHATPIEFNSTSRQHFAPFVAQLRPRPSPDPQALRAKQTSFSDLASKSFKFMNYARSSLVSGEKVIHTLWQPEIQESILPWRWLPFTRTIATAHLTILTDKELILISDVGKNIDSNDQDIKSRGEFTMRSIEPRNRGETWVLRIGKASLKKYRPWIYLLFVALWIPIGIYWGYALLEESRASAVLGFATSIFVCTSWTLLALLYFERRHFYRIIQRQAERIAALEQQVNDASQSTNKENR